MDDRMIMENLLNTAKGACDLYSTAPSSPARRTCARHSPPR